MTPEGRWDWAALKLEWLQTDLSPGAFRKLKEIGNESDFYSHVEVDEWHETRDRIRKEASDRVEAKLVTATAKKWGEYRQLFQASKAQIATIFSKTVIDGKVVRPLSPLETAQLVGAIERMLKAESFMDGGPSERIESKNLNMDMVDLIDRIERGDI